MDDCSDRIGCGGLGPFFETCFQLDKIARENNRTDLIKCVGGGGGGGTVQ
jgi:hypothetical protein